jgi:ligand-binding sensor domain-containing protein/two-component sensor histidine kinase
MNKIPILIGLTFQVMLLKAQDSVLLASRHLDLQNGLADHHVKYIFQDKRGIIWLNTVNGLQRFNGNQFYTFTYNQQQPGKSLPSGIMNFGIAEDKEGNIWSVTEHEGPVKIQQVTGYVSSFRQFVQSREQLRTHTVVCTNKNKLYVSSINGLQQISNDTLRTVPLDETIANDRERKNQRSIVHDQQGRLWIATSKGFLLLDEKQNWFFNEKNPKGIKLLNNSYNISAVLKDKDEQIWYSSWQLQEANKRFLYKYDLRKNRIDSVLLPQPETGSNDFFSIPIAFTQDQLGHTWMATLGGHLYVYNSSMQLLNDYSYLQWGEKRTRAESLYALFCDTDGNVWISCAEGIFITTPKSNSFTSAVSISQENFSMQDDNTTVMVAASGEAYLNNKGKGIYYWNKETNQLQFINQTAVNGSWKNFQTFLTSCQNRLYFTPWFSDAVIDYDERTKRFHPFIEPGVLQHLGVKSIPLDEELLFAGKYSIKRFSTDGRFIDSVQLNRQHSILTDWKATGNSCLLIDTGASIYLLQTKTALTAKKIVDLDLRGSVFKIGSTNRHYLIGTQYEGIKIIDKKGKPVKTISTKDGLLSNNIFNIFTDEANRIWIETPNGFNYISDPNKMEVYAVPQLDKRYNRFISARHDGHLGFYLLYNDRVEHIPYLSFEKPNAKPFVFTSVRAGEQLLPLQSNDEPVSLSWKNNSLRVEFAALDYIHAGSMQYRYRLNGKKDDWITAGNSNNAIFANLQSGSYLLEVQYRHPNGNWQPKSLIYRFVIHSPFWQQWWFITLLLLVILIPVFIILRREYLSRKQIERIRWQLSRDLHDDVGSTLSSIAVYSSVLENRLHQEKEKSIVTEIKEKATDSIQNMSDIVWAIQPENDSLQDFVQRFKAWALPLLESRNIQFMMHSDASDAGVSLNMLQRRNLYLVCKEAMNNCIKYAQASKIEFTYRITGRTLQISLQDNGIGFNEQLLTRRNGLLNMKHRMEELNGTFSINTTTGNGCCITATLPIA